MVGVGHSDTPATLAGSILTEFVIVLICSFVLLANIYDHCYRFPYSHMTFHLLSLMRPPVMLSQHSMDRTALLVISHMFVQYIKDSADWVVPQSVRQYHYGFPSRKVLVTLLSCLLGYCLRSERIACRIDFNRIMGNNDSEVFD